MKVKDLIAALQLMPQELQVYLYCDHGQTPEKTSGPQVYYTDELTYNLEIFGIDDFDREEYNLNVPFVML